MSVSGPRVADSRGLQALRAIARSACIARYTRWRAACSVVWSRAAIAAWSSSSTNRRRSTSWWTRGEIGERGAAGARWSSSRSTIARRVRVRSTPRRAPRPTAPPRPAPGRAPGRWRGCARSRSRYHLARSGSRSSPPAASARTHRGLGEVLGVGVVATERPGVAEDLGAVLDHDLAEVDDVVVVDPRPPCAPSVSALARSPPEGRAHVTYIPGHRVGNGSLRSAPMSPPPWPASSSPGSCPTAGSTRSSPPATSWCSARATSRTPPSELRRAVRRGRRDRLHPHRPHRRRGAAGGRAAAAGRRQRRRGLRQHRRRHRGRRSASRCATPPGVLDETTADLAFLLMLAAARRAYRRRGRPAPGAGPGFHIDDFLGVDVHGATLGIVGYGRIGRAVARRAAGFGMEVLHHTRHDTGITGWVARPRRPAAPRPTSCRCTSRCTTRRAG